MGKSTFKKLLSIQLLLASLLIITAGVCSAQQQPPIDPAKVEAIEKISTSPTQTATLVNLLRYKSELDTQIRIARNKLKSAHTMDKEALTMEIRELQQQLEHVEDNFIKVATGIDVSVFEEEAQQGFAWREEIETLVKPLVHELKEMTKRPRQIEKLKSRVAYFETKLPRAQEAIENIDLLIASTEAKVLKGELQKLKEEFVSRKTDITNQLDVARFELQDLMEDEKSFFESTKQIMAVFFKSRGKNILIALLAFAGVFLLFRSIDRGFKKYHPAFKAKERPFYIRLFEVVLLFMTVFAATAASLFTLYVSGDWFLLSIAIIFILGALWTAREGFTRYYEQVKLILNLGSVRENERIIYNGVPWMVESLQLFCRLKNPALSPSRIRLPIAEMSDINSRPVGRNEPWFPCAINDWVILSDGVRGKVISQSPDMVELVQRGGAYVTYQTSDFLGLNPKNLSRNFRLKSVFGIDYSLQAESTSSILEKAKEFIAARIAEDGYDKHLLNLNVEFESAGASSLNLVIIADFHGETAALYGRLLRALQRYSVQACTEYDWNIPFSQMVIHRAE